MRPMMAAVQKKEQREGEALLPPERTSAQLAPPPTRTPANKGRRHNSPHASQSGAATQLSARQPIRGGETVLEEDTFFSPERGQTVKTEQILFKRFRFICILCCKTLCFNSKLQKRQYVLLSF